MMARLSGLVDWRRGLLLSPVLLVTVLGVYLLVGRDGTAETPRATLLDTQTEPELQVGVDEGQLARDFSGHSPAGELLRLSDLRGRPVVVNFWATWCAACASELPDLRDLQAELRHQGLAVLAVNVGEGSDRARSFLDRFELNDIRAVLDPTLVVADAYGVRGMPQSVFIDAEGIVRGVYVGPLDEQSLREYAMAAVDAVPPPERTPPLRFVTTVARDRVLEVEDLGGGRVEVRSKSLRCDDSYCARPLADELRDFPGVHSVAADLGADPAELRLQVDTALELHALAEHIAERLEALDDPLYTRPIEIVLH
jgi:peroxiredoxin